MRASKRNANIWVHYPLKSLLKWCNGGNAWFTHCGVCSFNQSKVELINTTTMKYVVVVYFLTFLRRENVNGFILP